jgi:hypothetical protein
MTLRRPRFLLASVPILVAVVACSSSSGTSPPPAADAGGTVNEDAGTFDAGPVQGSLAIDFESIGLAVYLDQVQVLLFDPGDAQTQCLTLIQTAKGGGTLPPTISGVPTQPVSPCQLASGVGALDVAFGTYTVLVIGKNSGQVVAAGCAADKPVTESAPTLSVTMNATGSVPATSCTKLSDHCTNKC